MIEPFRQAHAGSLTLEDPLRSATPSTASSTAARIPSAMVTIRQSDVRDRPDALTEQLCEAMITVSSNFAANL